MKAAEIVLAIVFALGLQTTLSRFISFGHAAVDFVLVAVMCVGLTSGPVAGMATGSLGGLIQDALSGGIIGVGGLAKSVVGFATGVLATQFIVARPAPRFVVFFGGSLLHAACFFGFYLLLAADRFEVPYRAVLTQAVGNAAVGLLAFQLVELLPGAAQRRRARRGLSHRWQGD